MTDELDSGQSGGTNQDTNSGGSKGNGDSSGSFDAAKLQSTIESLSRKLDEVDARSKALQGDKDRGVSQTKDEVKELKRKIAEIEKLKKNGLDEDGAIEEHSFREDIRAVKEQLSKLTSTQAQVTGNGPSLAEEQAQVFAEYKVDPNDPEAASLLSLKGVELVKEVSKLAIKRAKQSPPDSSEAGSIQGGPPAPKPGVEKLTEQYQKDLLAIPRGEDGRAQRIALKEKARKEGVPVDRIGVK